MLMTCDDCIFRKTINALDIEMQTGCKFRKDVKKLPADSDTFSWRLQGLCQYKRGKGWKHKDLPIDDQYVELRKEIRPTFDLAFCSDDEQAQFSYVQSFSHLPALCTSFYRDPAKYMESLSGNYKDESWKKRTCSLDSGVDWRIIQGREAKSSFFGCFKDIRIIPSNFLEWLDIQINEGDLRFAVAASGEDVLISRKFFKDYQLSTNDMITEAAHKNMYVNLNELIEEAMAYGS